LKTPELAYQLQPQNTDTCASGDEGLQIGLVNNMPDAALRSTERQFRSLLVRAAQGLPFRLSLYFMPERPRTEAAWSHLSKNYEDVGKLWGSKLDGLIVTGAEPNAHSLRDEPYWRTLVRLVDWAEDHTTSTIWLCLAAHAAVLHLDGLERRPFPEKLFGVFDCMKARDHAILDGLPPSWRVPHSRCNDLPEHALVAHGYSILSRSPDVGADIFVRQTRSLFVFAQGHPEYDVSVLLREYRRDVARFLSGEKDDYPGLPRGYFEEQTESELHELRQLALLRRDIDVLLAFPATARVALAHTWQLPAHKIYANWLCFLAERKTTQGKPWMFWG
jgi:homoserine O-succinyltransferase/O-acetyltransferase